MAACVYASFIDHHGRTLGACGTQFELGLCDRLYFYKRQKHENRVAKLQPHLQKAPPFPSPLPLSLPPSPFYCLLLPPPSQTVSLLSCFIVSPLGFFALLNTFVVRSGLPPHLFSFLPFLWSCHFNENTVNNYGEVLTTLQRNSPLTSQL